MDVRQAIRRVVKGCARHQHESEEKGDERGPTHDGRGSPCTETKAGGESLAAPDGDRGQGQCEQAIAEPVQCLVEGQGRECRSVRVDELLDADDGESQQQRQAQRLASV
jgi:hypothetical protein